MIRLLQVPTIDLADCALTGPAQETAAAGAAITVVVVVVDDCEPEVVDDCEPQLAPASASAVAPTATEIFRINSPSG